jgi:hypothetical protein
LTKGAVELSKEFELIVDSLLEAVELDVEALLELVEFVTAFIVSVTINLGASDTILMMIFLS